MGLIHKSLLTAATGTRRAPRRAAATLELALTMAILVNLTFGMVEFGYYFFVKNTMQGAAREAHRGIVVGATYSSSITTAVQNNMSAAGFTNTSRYSFTVTDTTTSTTITTDAGLAACSAGDQLTVTVQATWSTIGGPGFRPMSLIGGTKIVSGSAAMRVE